MTPGNSYPRPHVRCVWHNRIRWIPVLGPPHSDKEILNFPPEHLHVDYRFLPAATANGPGTSHVTLSGCGPYHEVFTLPITAVSPILPPGHPLIPLQPNPTRHRRPRRRGKQPKVHPTLSLSQALDSEQDIPLNAWYRIRHALFRQNYPPHPGKVAPWMTDLQEAFKNSQLLPGPVCPHRLTPLAGIEPRDGIIECPLHGLRWHAATGRLHTG